MLGTTSFNSSSNFETFSRCPTFDGGGVHHHSLHEHGLRAKIKHHGLSEGSEDLCTEGDLHGVKAVVHAVLHQAGYAPLLTAALRHLLRHLGRRVPGRDRRDGEMWPVGIVKQSDAV